MVAITFVKNLRKAQGTKTREVAYSRINLNVISSFKCATLHSYVKNQFVFVGHLIYKAIGHPSGAMLTIQALVNRPFPSCLLPLCQNESKCKTIHMKMCSTHRFFFMQIKLVFIRMVLHLDSF